MMKQRNAQGLGVVVLLALVSGACIPSKYPLSDEKTSQPDERLVGVWRMEGDDTPLRVKKSLEKPKALELTQAESRAHDSFLFTTTVKSKNYVTEKLEVHSPPDKPVIVAFSIYQYAFVDKDTVEVRDMSEEVIAKAIADKQLDGEVRVVKTKVRPFLGLFGRERTVEEQEPTITARPEAIARYLEAHADECFPAKERPLLTWKRQK